MNIQDNLLTENDIPMVVALLRGVASVDGVTPEEDALIAEFAGDAPTFSGSADDAVVMLSALSMPARAFVLSMCALTAFADGHMTPAEEKHIRAVATRVGLDEATVSGIFDGVRDELLSKLSQLPDAGSVAQVAHELNSR